MEKFQRYLFRQYKRIYFYDIWIRQHFSETGHLWLIMLIVAGVFGLDTKESNSYQLFSLLAITFIVGIFAASLSRFKMTATRKLPTYMTAGQTTTYQVTIHNSMAKPYSHLLLIEQLEDELPDYKIVANFYQLLTKPWWQRGVSFNRWRRFRAWQRGGYHQPTPFSIHNKQTINIEFTPTRRGVIRFSSCSISHPDLLGLFQRLSFIAIPQSCIVLPPRYPLRALQLQGQRHYQAGGVALANNLGDSNEFMGLREYRQGDPLKNLHWKSIAKTNQLIVKEYQDEYFVRQALVLDTALASGSSAQFEAAVSVAASLLFSEQQLETLLDLMFIGNQSYCFTAGRGVDHLAHLLEVLASVQVSSEHSFQQLQQAVLNHSSQCGSIVAVLLHWDETRQRFIQALQSQGLAVAVFIVTEKKLSKPELSLAFYQIHPDTIAADLASI